ncbi:MAG: TetR/AcrR family transcriptional regulator [Acidobacteria bacterium]|nr:TetR/AcrR family transcriptional regulator [Acidobacteriota bacterium]
MTTRQPVPQRGAERRDDLTASTLKVFSAGGCFRTPVDAIAADVGVGKSTLYANFSSQGDLFAAAQRAASEGLTRRCTQVVDQAATGGDGGLREVIRALVGLTRESAALSPDTVSRLTCCNRWMHGQTSVHDGGGSLAPVVSRWQEAALLDRAADPHWVSTVIMAIVSSPLMVGTLTRNEADDLVERIATLVEATFGAGASDH